MRAGLKTVLAAAARAPSGDNTQPWRFTVTADSSHVGIHLDPNRDVSPMNAGQRMAGIAIGAAVENVMHTCAINSWDAQFEVPSPGAVATIRLEVPDRDAGRTDPWVLARVTNRRFYDGRPIPSATWSRLRAAPPDLDGVITYWLSKEQLAVVAPLVGRADALMFAEKSMRQAFLAQVRFDRAPNSEVEEGLSLASLELSRMDRLALQTMRRLPTWLLRLSGGLRALEARARRLVESASGLCLVCKPKNSPHADINVGRTVQRAWLALAREGLAAQPMMSLLVLDNVLENGTPALISTLGRPNLVALHDALCSATKPAGDLQPAFLMRFGFSQAPTGRTGRLPLSDLVTEVPVIPPEHGARHE